MQSLQDILKAAKEDFTKEYSDPIERLKSNSEKALKYSEILFRINRKRNKLRVQVNAKYSELYKKIRYDSSYLCKTLREVESFIDTDEEYMKLKNELDELENASQLLDNLVGIYRQREYSERLIFMSTTGMNGSF
jgi:hypothetical protein